MKSSPLQKLVRIYGSPVKAARSFGVDRQVVDKWFKKGWIPYSRAPFIMRETNGKIEDIEVWKHTSKIRGD